MGSGEGDRSEDDLLDDLAELAAAEWGIHPREFWDTRANVSDTPDADLGITNRLLGKLIHSYLVRRRRELSQLAVVVRTALATKPSDVKTALEKISPVPKQPAPIEVDEHGDPVRAGWVVGFWDHIYKDTA